MFNLIFKKYDYKNDIDWFNYILKKASKDRFELRRMKNGIFYLYDYDSNDFDVMVRSKKEIKDILMCMNLHNFVFSKSDKVRLNNILEMIFCNIVNLNSR